MFAIGRHSGLECNPAAETSVLTIAKVAIAAISSKLRSDISIKMLRPFPFHVPRRGTCGGRIF